MGLSVYWSQRVITISKIANQMWHNHPFSQRNRTTKRTVTVGVGGDREVGEGGVGQNLKQGEYAI